jgi:tRNA pseudouridine13 synthase
MDEPRTPHAPNVATSDLDGTFGTIGPEPEDFQVDEVPLYEPCGEGEHLYVRFKKRGWTTRDATRAIADASGAPMNEIGSAGMKDKHAVTTQWISMPARRARPVESWELPEGISVEESSRHKNKLRTGHLKGNRFRIRLVDVVPGALPLAERILAELRQRRLPNYFGAQRFGHGARNLEDALAWLEGGNRRVPPFERKLFSSVVQSEVFNRYVTLRLERGLDAPLLGEVVRLEGTGSHFVVEDTAKELPRWTARDIHPTGPMIGPKMKPARDEALSCEAAAIAATELTEQAREELGRFADGTRRDLTVPIDDAVVSGNEAERTLTLEFFLPSGSYATGLVRELTREPFFRYTH